MYGLCLAKGAQATATIEGNTLREEQVGPRIEGWLDRPPSQEYPGQEVQHILHACGSVRDQIMAGGPGLTPQWTADANREVPGEVPPLPVGVGRYRDTPREDCGFLLEPPYLREPRSEKQAAAARRRLNPAIALSARLEPVPKRHTPGITPEVARASSGEGLQDADPGPELAGGEGPDRKSP